MSISTMDEAKKYTKKIGWRHEQILLVCFGNIMAFSIRSNIAVAIVAMTDTNHVNSNIPTFDWDTQKTSLILGSLLWACAAVQAPTSYLMHGRNSVKILSSGIFICGVLNLLTPILAIHAGWVAVLCTRIIIGLFQGGLTHVKSEVIGNWAPTCERARLGTLINTSAEVGNISSMLVSGILASSKFGWPSIFYITGLISIIWSILYYILGAKTPASHKRISTKERDYIESNIEGSKNQDRTVPWKAILTSRPLWFLLLTRCCLSANYYVLIGMIPTYIKNALKFDIAKSGFLAALPFLANLLLSLPMSWLSDYALKKGMRLTTVRKCAGTIGNWGPALCLLILSTAKFTDPTGPIIMLVLAFGLYTGAICSYMILPSDLSPRYSGVLASMVETPAKISGSLSLVAYGAIVTDLKNEKQWYTAFYMSAFIFFIGHLMFLIFGTANVQPWNNPNCSKSESNNKLESQNNAIRMSRYSTNVQF